MSSQQETAGYETDVLDFVRRKLRVLQFAAKEKGRYNKEFKNKVCQALQKMTRFIVGKLRKLTSSIDDTGKELFGVKNGVRLLRPKT